MYYVHILPCKEKKSLTKHQPLRYKTEKPREPEQRKRPNKYDFTRRPSAETHSLLHSLARSCCCLQPHPPLRESLSRLQLLCPSTPRRPRRQKQTPRHYVARELLTAALLATSSSRRAEGLAATTMEVAEAPAPAPDEDGLDERGVALHLHLPRLLAGVVSGALTGLFALGTCTVAHAPHASCGLAPF